MFSALKREKYLIKEAGMFKNTSLWLWKMWSGGGGALEMETSG